jgi:hypothetical protein
LFSALLPSDLDARAYLLLDHKMFIWSPARVQARVNDAKMMVQSAIVSVTQPQTSVANRPQAILSYDFQQSKGSAAASV